MGVEVLEIEAGDGKTFPRAGETVRISH